jgi:hypothetical protein
MQFAYMSVFDQSNVWYSY